MEPSKVLIWLQLAAVAGGGFYLFGQLKSDSEAHNRYSDNKTNMLIVEVRKQSGIISENQDDIEAEMKKFNEMLIRIKMDQLILQGKFEHIDSVFSSKI